MKPYTLILASLLPFLATAQVDNPYHLNGKAFQESCNCYRLTEDVLFEAGSIWNINKISLNEPFDFRFNIFLGCTDADGADGIAFVLQPIGTSIGAQGGGIGYDGVNPSIGVLVDTWQNREDNDPFEDHIAIHKNGIIDHSPLTDVAEPMPALASGGNIEDCQWHTLRIAWDPVIKKISTQVDGVDRVSATIDMVADIFNGNDMVFWGFTAATGGSANVQKICTSLNPGFSFPVGQTTCFPEPVTFIDSSSSFGTIEKWFWDFGDGTTFNEANPPPHTYAEPGIYNVKLSILGNNGCVSDDFVKEIVMGTKPDVQFTYPKPVCEETPVFFKDTSTVQYGTINKWHWTIDGTTYEDESPPPVVFTGASQVSLSVETKEGCASDLESASIVTYPKPAADFTLSDVCYGVSSYFTSSNFKPSVNLGRWLWDFGNGDGRMTLTPRTTFTYPDKGEYTVQMTAFSTDGCAAETVSKVLKVYKTGAYAGNDTIIATGQTIQLNGSGGDIYKWTPAGGLSADDIPNPTATLPRDAEFVLTASTVIGCATTDTIRFKVYDGPALYVPSAFSPNNDGKNDQFKFIAVGMKSVDLFQVYNRYGQLIYSSANILKGWDGRAFGKDQPLGTYVWMIKGTDLGGAPHFKKGTVTLVR